MLTNPSKHLEITLIWKQKGRKIVGHIGNEEGDPVALLSNKNYELAQFLNAGSTGELMNELTEEAVYYNAKDLAELVRSKGNPAEIERFTEWLPDKFGVLEFFWEMWAQWIDKKGLIPANLKALQHAHRLVPYACSLQIMHVVTKGNFGKFINHKFFAPFSPDNYILLTETERNVADEH